MYEPDFVVERAVQQLPARLRERRRLEHGARSRGRVDDAGPAVERDEARYALRGRIALPDRRLLGPVVPGPAFCFVGCDELRLAVVRVRRPILGPAIRG